MRVLLLLAVATATTSALSAAASAATSETTSKKLGATGQLVGDWLVHKVAPAVATKLISNVLPTKAAPPTSSSSSSASSANQIVDTQALADKIVDRLADGIRRRKSMASHSSQDRQSAAPKVAADTSSQSDKPIKAQSKRQGKSLVGDSVSQMVQSLFAKQDQRTFLGRAVNTRHLLHSSQHRPSAAAAPPPPPQAVQHLQAIGWQNYGETSHSAGAESGGGATSAAASQLDENPVVLRAEHGHNLTTASSNSQAASLANQQQQMYLVQQQQQREMLRARQRLKLQQQLANRQNSTAGRHQMSGRRPGGQQSPYSLPTVTSDMNIVQATSSQAPPQTFVPTTVASTTTSTTQPTTTAAYYQPPAQQQQHQFSQVNSQNKFKFNNRHQQSTVVIPPSTWHTNTGNRYVAAHQRFQPQQQSPTTSTTTSTTTTTTTTTTPEPPPQTEPIDAALVDMEPQTMASIMSNALASLGSAALSSQLDSGDTGYSYQAPHSQQQLNLTASSSSSSSPPPPPPTKSTSARHSVISAEAIPTALAAPLYHQTHKNFTAVSIMGPTEPLRRGSSAIASPAAKAMAHYLQKGVTSLSSTIFSRQSKTWARRLGLSSVLLSGLLYGAAVLANPTGPLPTNGMEVLQAISKGTKKRLGSGPSLAAPVDEASESLLLNAVAAAATPQGANAQGDIDRITNTAALLDNNVNLLYQQQPHLMGIIEQLIQQEQLQQQQQQRQQNSLFSQRSLNVSPIEIENVEDTYETQPATRRQTTQPSQQSTLFTIKALGGASPQPFSPTASAASALFDGRFGNKVTFRGGARR